MSDLSEPRGSEATPLVELPWLLDGAEPRPGEDALLSDGDRAWILEDGEVELSVVDIADARMVARWTPLVTIGAGALLGGIHATPQQAVMARLSVDARLRPVNLTDLPAPDDTVAVVAESVDAWLEHALGALHSCVRPAEHHPLARRSRLRRTDLHVAPLPVSGSLSLAAGAMARVPEGIAWVNIERGTVRLLGRERSRTLDPGDLAPLGDADWLLVESDASLHVYSTPEIVSEGSIAVALSRFGTELLAILARRVARTDERERRLLLAREERDDRTFDVTVQGFAAILDARVGRLRGIADSAAFAAAQLIAAALGVPIRGPGASADAGSRVDIVSAIAHASRMRTRQIELSGRWWRRDFGPLMGFLEEDETPVALIPGRRGYVMHDSESGTSERVTRRSATRIGPDAREFYRPLPETAVTRRDLLRYGIAGSRRDLALLVITALGFAAVGLLVPILTGTVLGTLVPRAERRQITELCVLLLLSASVSTLFATAFNIAGLRLEGRLDNHFQAGIWDRLMGLSPRFFRDYSTGALATAALGVSGAREVLSGVAFKALLACVVALANLVLIAAYDLRLALFSVLVVAVGVAVSAAVGVRQMRHQVRVYEASKEINSRTYQIISGVAKVSTAAAEPRALAHWADSFARGRRHTFDARTGQNRLTAFNAAFTLLGAATAFLVVGELVHGVSRATFLVFNVAFFQVLASFLQVSATAMLAIQVLPSLRALEPILQAVPEAVVGKTDPGPLIGNLEVEDLTFAYTELGLPAVEGASFSVDAGEFLAIVGPSGCGKSTLLRLLLAFEAPQTGSIVYDGQNLAELDPVAVRRQCGVVLQDATLFAGDILSNIVGSGLYTYEDAWEALVMCGMDADVAQMPMGMYTMLSDGGGTLSGGQRQRLLLARAMVARPRILFLDEATSALDNRTQEVVTESMRKLNATRVVIAHRLSTIRGADHIVVFEGGRIVQRGTYEELLDTEGLFRMLALRQLA